MRLLAFQAMSKASPRIGIAPTMVHAGVYAATTHLLQTIEAGADPDHGAATIAAMKRRAPDQAPFGPSTIRSDGGVSHPMHLFRVRAPAASASAWDLYQKLRSVPAEGAVRPLDACSSAG